MPTPEQTTECQRCDYVTENLELYGDERPEWLCALCAGTHTGHSNSNIRVIVRSMCYIGNAIIAAIKEGKT